MQKLETKFKHPYFKGSYKCSGYKI